MRQIFQSSEYLPFAFFTDMDKIASNTPTDVSCDTAASELTPEFWKFVDDNRTANPAQLRLKWLGRKCDSAPLDYALAITQIECRQRFGKKLAETLARDPQFLFPDVLAGEQCTSDLLARWHATLTAGAQTVTDMTAGLGIDAWHVADGGAAVTAIEQRPAAAQALAYNGSRLVGQRLEALCGDSMELLAGGRLKGDVLFADPARRGDRGQRLFAITDCQPDMTQVLDMARGLFRKSVIKLSPMLDITATIAALDGITDIYAVGTRTECSEVVAVVNIEDAGDSLPTPSDHRQAQVSIHAVTLAADWDQARQLTATADGERQAPAPDYGMPHPGDVVVEPWPAVMKAALFKIICQKYGLHKVSPNTHVFWTDVSHDGLDEAGRQWRVEAVVDWQSRNIKRFKGQWPRAQVAVRNMGMTAEALAGRLGVREAPDTRVVGLTDNNGGKALLVLKPL